MKWSAFSAAIDDLRDPICLPEHQAMHHHVGRVLELAQRFYVPDGDSLLEGKRYADIFDLLRLPFECTAILSRGRLDDIGIDTDMITVAIECDSETARQLRIFDFTTMPDGAWISLTSIFLDPPNREWRLWGTVLIRKGVHESGESGLEILPCDDSVTTTLVQKQGIDTIAGSMQHDLNIVTTLCAMLGMKNVQTHHIEAPRSINEKRKRKGKSLLLDYHVLKVDGEVWNSEAAGDRDALHGSRSHLRRGHIRRLSDGRRTWVRAAYVHGRVDGFVTKDYEVGK